MIKTIDEAKQIFKMYMPDGNRSQNITRLYDHMVQSGFYKAPASTKYHLNIECGLAIHTAHVMLNLYDLNSAFGSPYLSETLFLVSFIHDAHKVCDMFGNPQYIEQTSKWHREKLNENYKWNEEQFCIDSTFKSVLIAQKFLDLSSHEIQAILYHDGPFDDKFKKIQTHVYPLTVMLHMADLYAAFVQENEKPIFPNELFKIERGE